MRSINFSLRADLHNDQQASALEKLNSSFGIHKATLLSPNSKSARLRRQGYAYVKDDADLKSVLKMVGNLSEVEIAEVPAERKLI